MTSFKLQMFSRIPPGMLRALGLFLTIVAVFGHLMVWYAMPTVDLVPGTPQYNITVGTHPIVFLIIGLLFLPGIAGIILNQPRLNRFLVLYSFIIVLVYVATRQVFGGNRLIEPLGVLSSIDELLLIIVIVGMEKFYRNPLGNR